MYSNMPIYISNRKEEKAKWADTRSALTYYKLFLLKIIHYILLVTFYCLLYEIRDTIHEIRIKAGGFYRVARKLCSPTCTY